MNELKIFEYNGVKITFENNDKVMVNITEVAKAFPDKNLSTIVNSQEIKEYVHALAAIKKFIASDLLQVRNGIGTWAESKVALRIAQKLSPDFAVWVDMKIEELLITGKTSIQNLTKKQILEIALEAEIRAEKLQIKNELQQKELAAAAPKVQYHDEVLQASNTFTSTTIAKELGMSAQAMHHLLKQKGVIFFQDKHWVLYSKYQAEGYTKTRTHTFETVEDGRIVVKTNIQTVWTEKGRQFIHRKLNSILTPAQS